MKSTFTIALTFDDRPLAQDLINATTMMGDLIAKNYAYPFDAWGLQSLGFGGDRQQIQWRLTLEEKSDRSISDLNEIDRIVMEFLEIETAEEWDALLQKYRSQASQLEKAADVLSQRAARLSDDREGKCCH